jgi:hypothetical protein
MVFNKVKDQVNGLLQTVTQGYSLVKIHQCVNGRIKLSTSNIDKNFSYMKYFLIILVFLYSVSINLIGLISL